MKKKYVFTGVLLSVLLIAGILTVQISQTEALPEEKEELHIVTSFYPVYTAVLNITNDIDGIAVTNLTDQAVGCLHDYQLSTEDMAALAEADIFIINGGGMEGYMGHVISQYPDLTIINASEGIELLTDDGYAETEEAHDQAVGAQHDHSHEINAHVWMSIDRYIQQISNIADRLAEEDSERAELYRHNAGHYNSDLHMLQDEAQDVMEQAEAANIIIFHDSFVYFAEEYGLDIRYMIEMDEETTLSAGEVAELIDVIRDDEVEVLFAEEQYGTKIADAVAGETQAQVYILDSLVTGDSSGDQAPQLGAYISGMRYNLEVLKEALCR